MNKTTKTNFTPDYAVHPGETLEGTLESSSMTQAELSRRTGLSRKTINGIINGREPITPDTAIQLEKVFRVPVRFWLNLQRNFEESTARIRERVRLEKHLDWIKDEGIPFKELAKRGVLKATREPLEQLHEVLGFFGVASPEEHRKIWEKTKTVYSYRLSPRSKARFGAISAWLRIGELAARDIRCGSFDKIELEQSLGSIRAMIPLPISQTQKRITQLLSDCGVILLFAPGIPGAPIHGATRWLPDDRALVQMSVRGKNDGDLWFTLFHELGHILRHGKRDIFLEFDYAEKTEKEEEANAFSRDFLIHPQRYKEFLIKHHGDFDSPRPLRISRQVIRTFAASIGISPGIVVGRLQHDGWLLFSHCNGLKQKLQFVEN